MTKLPKVRRWDGKPISEPGIYADVPMESYHGAHLCDAPSISSSGLRTIINKSPAHYWAYSPYNEDRATGEETDALILGRAAHHLLLGQDDFSTLFVQRPAELGGEKWNGNRTVCKRWLADRADEGRTVLTENQVAQIRGMAKSLSDNVLIRSGLLNGLVEHSMVWRCKDTGIYCKARPDAIPNDSGDFGDLKTCASVQDDDLRRAIADYGLHQQGAFILEGWAALTDAKSDFSFNLVFVEKQVPWCSRVVAVDDQDLLRGEQQNAIAKGIFKRCLEKGYWPGPGYENDAMPLSMPKWVQERIDYQLQRNLEEAA